MKNCITGDFEKLRGEPPLKYLAKANQMVAEGHDMVRFEIGQPDFDTPDIIKDAAKKAAHSNSRSDIHEYMRLRRNYV